MSLLLLYLFTYAQSEAVRIASCDRYMYTYLLGALVFILYIALGRSKRAAGTAIGAGLCVVVLAAGIATGALADFTVRAPVIAAQTHAMRAPYAATEAFSRELIPGQDKVFVISQRSTGLDKLVIHYNATPVVTSLDYWSLGKPYYDGDIWTKDLTADQWRELLHKGGYRYVYLYKADDQFRKGYGSLFADPTAIADRTLFRVQTDTPGPCLVYTVMPE